MNWKKLRFQYTLVGMLMDEHRKEDFSRAYILAVAAKAGVIVSINDRNHDYGIDGSFHQVS
ncbi:MAG: hypothetical protein ACHQUC_07550, partial [Chlamydiales bacterium]